MSFYGNVKEELPLKMPKPRGNPITIPCESSFIWQGNFWFHGNAKYKKSTLKGALAGKSALELFSLANTVQVLTPLTPLMAILKSPLEKPSSILKVVSTSMPLPTNGYHWIIK
jgi:hypothetical protein